MERLERQQTQLELDALWDVRIVVLATILTISYVSNNPTPSAWQSLFIIFAPRRHRCLATVSKGERPEDTESTRDVLSRSNCSKLTVTEVRC